MKRILLASLFIVLVGQVGFSQSAKLYVVINEATWCPYCKANGQRVRKTIDEYCMKNQTVKVIHNDVTDKKTREKFLGEFKKIGIGNYMSTHVGAATVYVFDAKTKKNLDGFTITSTDENILMKLEKNLKKVG